MAIEASQAAQAYARAAKIQAQEAGGVQGPEAGGQGPDFGAMVQDAIGGAIETAKTGEAMSMAGVNGDAALVDVVTAVSAAEVTVQSVVAVRDKVISAYQEILRMPI